MANIGLDGRIRNDENGHDVPLRSKQMVSNEGRLIKKQAFGELKNVMQNQQIGVTPIKGNAAKIDGLPGQFSASSSLCNDVLRKQQLKQNFLDAQKLLEQKYKTELAVGHYKEPIFDEEIFDSWDYERKCCQHQKREEEIWSAMDLERHLDFHNNLNRSAIDEDEINTSYPIDPMLFDYLDDPLPVQALDSMIEREISSPSLLDICEDLDF